MESFSAKGTFNDFSRMSCTQENILRLPIERMFGVALKCKLDETITRSSTQQTAHGEITTLMDGILEFA